MRELRYANNYRSAGALVLALLFAFSVGCESQNSQNAQEAAPTKGAEASKAEVQDEEPESERRVVSLGGTVSEIVWALGAGDEVVAVDKSSIYPEQTEPVRNLDLFRNVSAEAVLSFEPTLVVATEGAKPDKAFERIEKAGVEVVRLDADETVEAAKKRIETLGEVLDRAEEAEALVARLDEEVGEAKAAAEACEKPAKTLFVYARGRGTTFVAGKDTSAARMIELAGAEHVPGDIEGFKPMTAEAVLEANPDMVLMTEHGLKSIGGAEGLRSFKGLGQTSAVEQGRVVTMGDLELLGFGPRTGEATTRLAGLLCLDEPVAEAGEESDER